MVEVLEKQSQENEDFAASTLALPFEYDPYTCMLLTIVVDTKKSWDLWKKQKKEGEKNGAVLGVNF